MTRGAGAEGRGLKRTQLFAGTGHLAQARLDGVPSLESGSFAGWMDSFAGRSSPVWAPRKRPTKSGPQDGQVGQQGCCLVDRWGSVTCASQGGASCFDYDGSCGAIAKASRYRWIPNSLLTRICTIACPRTCFCLLANYGYSVRPGSHRSYGRLGHLAVNDDERMSPRGVE